MNCRTFEQPGKKFKTCHRDDMYHVIWENDPAKLFSSMVNIFLMSFAVGFHLEKRAALGPGSINHVNMVNIGSDHQDLIIVLMLDRHPDLSNAQDLWAMVEEYAEYGIQVLFESLKRSDWVLDIDDVFTGAED